ncbi:DNRLRE domain-containing protein [Actinosynnema sp. NPDC049800]
MRPLRLFPRHVPIKLRVPDEYAFCSTGRMVPLRAFFKGRSLVSAALTVTLIGASVVALPSVFPTRAERPETAAGGPAPDGTSALRTARLRNAPVEVVGQRTETSTTWANPDGSFRTELAAGPVRTKKDGEWLTVDPALRVDRDGVRPKATGWEATFARARGAREQTTALVSTQVGGHDVTIGWQGALPEPEVDGVKITYPDVRPDTDLVVESRRSGFEQYFVLKRRPTGPVSFSVPITVEGLEAVRTSPGGMVEFVDDAGTVIATMPPPRMWGAERDERLGEPTRSTPVDHEVNQSGDAVTVTLRPDQGFLADPAVAYPVTVDPYLVFRTTFDTYVDTTQGNTPKHTQIELQSGTNGEKIARSLLNFDVGPLRGATVEQARVIVWNDNSYVCEPRPVELWSTSGPADATTVWANRPTLGQRYDVKVESHHHNSCGGSAWIHFNATELVRSWLATPNNLHSALIKAGDEKNIKDWKKFQSADAASAWPRLDVTYTWPLRLSAPAVTPSTAPEASPTWTRSDRPTLNARVEDDDDLADEVTFELQEAGGTPVTSGTVTSTTPNATVSWQVPTPLTAGTAYRFRAKATKNSVEAASPWLTFTPDFVAPAAPAVASSDYPEGRWAGGTGTPGSFTVTPPTADVSWVVWRLDDGPSQEVPYSGTPHTITVTPESDGRHTLTAWARDAAGNDSSPTTYRFHAGTGAVTSPEPGARTARRVQLSALARAELTTVTYAYRRGAADTWKPVPQGDVRRKSDGAQITWPVGVSSDLVWDVTRTLTTDGVIQIRAEFTAGQASQGVDLVVDRAADAAASEQIGPGTVNLLTGDYALSADDVSAFGVGISRTFSSRDPLAGAEQDGTVAMFGPAWTSGGTSQDAVGQFTQLRATSATSVEVVRTDDTAVGFTRDVDGTWVPQPDAGELSLTHDASNDRYSLRDTEGRTTVFAKVAAEVSTYAVRTTFPATANAETVYVYDAVVGADHKTRARLRKIIPPTTAVSSPAQCDVEVPTTLPHGCRVVELVYAPRTTATATVLGDYTGQVSLIKVWESGATVRETGLGRYAYDTLGRLREVWDPRLSPALKTKYEYDSGRISRLTPPGELPWTFYYGRAGNDDTAGDGMLLAVSRPALEPGTKNEVEGDALTTLVYDVPVSGQEAPHDMAELSVAAWAQRDAPTDATAIFPADQVPGSHTGRDNLGAGDYRRATVHYLNPDAREVNEIQPGGHTSTTEHDEYGNVVRTLSAANRQLALGDGARSTHLGMADKSPAERAALLSTTTVYEADGQRKTHEYGPLHVIQLANAVPATGGVPVLPVGSRVPARTHKAVFYDEGRPADGSAKVENKETREVTGAAITGYPVDADQRTRTTEYDWTNGLETRTVQDPGGLALATTTVHDPQGRPIESSLPASSGNDAATTVTTYYSAAVGGHCGGRPEWAGMICRVEPKAPITGGGANPSDGVVKTTTYAANGLVDQTIESAGGVSRVTSTTYDPAGRKVTVTVTGGLGAPVPAVTTEYDPATGRVARTVGSDGAAVAVGYDALGRVLTYTDADGGRTTYHNDALNRPVKVTNTVPSEVTYEYDTTREPRGLAVGMTDSIAGTFTATYGPGGEIVEQKMPSGVIMRDTVDETGVSVRRSYTAANSVVLLDSTSSNSVHNQVLTQADLSTQDFQYDAVGRLVRADDTCVTRSYGYDRNSNRTSKQTTTCQGGNTVEAHAYDTKDRLVDEGHGYDAFGRTVTMTGGAGRLTYYVNDRIHTQAVGGAEQTWTMDATSRVRSTALEGGWTRINHYGTEHDTPDWIVEDRSTNALTRNVKGLDNDLAATTSASGDVQLQLTDLHGDITVVYDPATATATTRATDEFGVPRQGQAPTRYGWLGAAQRSSETLDGMMVMGVRLYNPATGRFLQVDAVANGNVNSYDYCVGDPNNCSDTSGYNPNCEWRWGMKMCGRIINLTPLPILVAKDWGTKSPTKWLWPGGRTTWGQDWDGVKVFAWGRVYGVWIAPWRWFHIRNSPRWLPAIIY